MAGLAENDKALEAQGAVRGPASPGNSRVKVALGF